MRAFFAAILVICACSGRGDGASLDEKWKKVVALSRPRIAPADPTLLTSAMETMLPERDRVREALDSARSLDQPPDVSPEIAATVDALASWYEERGGLSHRSCADLSEGGQQIMAAVTIADLALASAAPTARQARVEAVLYLGHRLREEGASLLDVVVGSEIADKGIRFATEQKIAPTPAFRELAPGPSLLPRTLAAEAMCMLELARQPGGENLAPSELDALRRFYLSVIDDLARGGSDDDLVKRLEALTEKAHGNRAHPTLKVIVPRLGDTVGRLLEQRRRYHAFLRGIR